MGADEGAGLAGALAPGLGSPDVPGDGVGVGRGVTVTVTVSGEIAATVIADGSEGTTGTSLTPGSSAATLSEITIGEASRRSRSAVEPNSVSRTWVSEGS